MVAGHYETLERALRTAGYTLVVPQTSDQAVALCLHNSIAAVLIDEGTLEAVEDWSLARSLKGGDLLNGLQARTVNAHENANIVYLAVVCFGAPPTG